MRGRLKTVLGFKRKAPLLTNVPERYLRSLPTRTPTLEFSSVGFIRDGIALASLQYMPYVLFHKQESPISAWSCVQEYSEPRGRSQSLCPLILIG